MEFLALLEEVLGKSYGILEKDLNEQEFLEHQLPEEWGLLLGSRIQSGVNLAWLIW